jgi:hypothetical protein
MAAALSPLQGDWSMKSQINWSHWIAMQAGVPPISMSSPGAAKTACHRALADATGRRFIQFIAEQHLPEDCSGAPLPIDIELADGTVHRATTPVLPEVMVRAKHEPTVLLFDEINQCGHSMLGAIQEWFTEPPAECWMAGCMNPVERSTNGVELSPPFVNRICLLQWDIPKQSIKEGWRNGFKGYPAPEVPIVPADYLNKHGHHWGNLLADFEERCPHLFGEQAFPSDPNKACDPWPSYRSWTNVGKLMAAAESVWANARVRAELVTGCVGEGPANEFLTYLGVMDLPNPEDLLRRPDTLELPQRFDLQRAIMASLINAVKENNTGERWERLFDCVEIAFEQHPETALSCEGYTWKVKPAGHSPAPRNGVASEMRRLRLQPTS